MLWLRKTKNQSMKKKRKRLIFCVVSFSRQQQQNSSMLQTICKCFESKTSDCFQKLGEWRYCCDSALCVRNFCLLKISTFSLSQSCLLPVAPENQGVSQEVQGDFMTGACSKHRTHNIKLVTDLKPSIKSDTSSTISNGNKVFVNFLPLIF